MKKVAAFFFAIASAACVMAQEGKLQLIHFDKNKRLEVKLLDSEVVSSSSGFNLNISIVNRTDSAFILYGFKDFGCGGGGKDVYLQSNITVGSELCLLDKKNEEVCLDIDGERQRLLSPNNRYSHSWKETVDMTYKSRIIVQPKSSETFTFKINLRSGLKKGTYKLQMLYYSGVNVVNIINEETIIKDQKETGGLLYQGYSESTSIKLKFK